MKMEIFDKKIIEERRRIGQRLKQVRKAYGITQKKLAKCIGIDQEAISKIENGARSTGIDQIIKICYALDAKLDFFQKE